MKNEIFIRKAVESDIEEIKELYDDLCDYLEEHENFPGWKKDIYPVREDAEKGVKENALFVALIEEKIVGTFILRHKPEAGYKNATWLTENDYSRIYVVYTLAVHPEFMKYGVGQAMLQFAEKFAIEEGCISIRLDVVKGNIPAERLYVKSGFRFIDTVSLGYEEYGLPWYNLYEKVLINNFGCSEKM